MPVDVRVAGVHAQRRAEWVGVVLNGTDFTVVTGSLAHVLVGVNVAVVDVPVVLSADRDADRLVRAILGEPRRHSIFDAPHPTTIAARDFDDANVCNRRATGRGVPVQMFNLFDHIREVQQVRTCDVREGHPELSFLAATGAPMNESRATHRGLLERFSILDVIGFPRDLFKDQPAPATIDVLEAAVLAYTASRVASGTAIALGTGSSRMWR